MKVHSPRQLRATAAAGFARGGAFPELASMPSTCASRVRSSSKTCQRTGIAYEEWFRQYAARPPEILQEYERGPKLPLLGWQIPCQVQHGDSRELMTRLKMVLIVAVLVPGRAGPSHSEGGSRSRPPWVGAPWNRFGPRRHADSVLRYWSRAVADQVGNQKRNAPGHGNVSSDGAQRRERASSSAGRRPSGCGPWDRLCERRPSPVSSGDRIRKCRLVGCDRRGRSWPVARHY